MWKIELLNEAVRDELKALPKDQQAKFTRIAGIIKEHGLENVREPYVKHLEQGLWEIRMKGRDGISRAFYVIGRYCQVNSVAIDGHLYNGYEYRYFAKPSVQTTSLS